MANHDPRVDPCIAKSADFAQPILEHLRALIHEACPDVEAGLQWSMPFFSYHGATMRMMAAFKQHCSFRFWLTKEVLGDDVEEDGMGQVGKLSSLRDLPSDKKMATYIGKAMPLALARATASPESSRPARPCPARRSHRAARAEETRHRKQNPRRFRSRRTARVRRLIGEAKTDATGQKRPHHAGMADRGQKAPREVRGMLKTGLRHRSDTPTSEVAFR